MKLSLLAFKFGCCRLFDDSFAGRHRYGSVPDGYVCRFCKQTGHHASVCPSKPEVVAPHIKKPTGIPNSFLTIVDDPLAPGALLTDHGEFAVPTIDALVLSPCLSQILIGCYVCRCCFVIDVRFLLDVMFVSVVLLLMSDFDWMLCLSVLFCY